MKSRLDISQMLHNDIDAAMGVASWCKVVHLHPPGKLETRVKKNNIYVI